MLRMVFRIETSRFRWHRWGSGEGGHYGREQGREFSIPKKGENLLARFHVLVDRYASFVAGLRDELELSKFYLPCGTTDHN